MRAVDIARQHHDEVALIAQIVGQPAAIRLIQRRQLAHEVVANLEEAHFGVARGVLVGRCRASPPHLHISFEERLLAGAHLDAKLGAALLGSRGIGGDQLIEPVARPPPPAFGAKIAQDGGDHRQSDQALLPVDDFEQPRLALAHFREIAAGAVDEDDGAEEIVGFLGASDAAEPSRPENVLEQLPCLSRGPRIRPLVTGHGKVEG